QNTPADALDAPMLNAATEMMSKLSCLMTIPRRPISPLTRSIGVPAPLAPQEGQALQRDTSLSLFDEFVLQQAREISIRIVFVIRESRGGRRWLLLRRSADSSAEYFHSSANEIIFIRVGREGCRRTRKYEDSDDGDPEHAGYW